MKHIDAIKAFSMINKMGNKVTGKTAYEMFKLKTELKKIVDFQSEEEMKLVDKYGGIVEQNGLIVISDGENRYKFQQEHIELGNLECDIKPIDVELDRIPEITMEEIEALYGFVNFK